MDRTKIESITPENSHEKYNTRQVQKPAVSH